MLDVAEFILEIEDAFDLDIPEDSRLRTVGDLIAFIRDRLARETEAVCYAGFAFRRLADALRNANIGPSRIRPSTPLANLGPLGEFGPDADAYRRLRTSLGDWQNRLPDLETLEPLSFGAASHLLLALGAMGTGWGVASALSRLSGAADPWPGEMLLPAGLGAIALGLVVEAARGNLPQAFYVAGRFPYHCQTVGALATLLSARLRPADFGGRRPHPNETARRVRRLLANNFHRDPANFPDDADLMNDVFLDGF